MSVGSTISRFRNYHRKHGTRATWQRLKNALHRARLAGQMVLFQCNLPVADAAPSLGILDRKQSAAGLGAEELEKIVAHWNPEAMRQLIAERFAAGAQLWLLRWNGALTGYGWTLAGKTMEPHYFPLAAGDAHLFDFFVFPEFRGRGLNPSLVGQILTELGREGFQRAFIEAAAWNEAQLASLKKTPFQKLGVARKFRWGKSIVVSWEILEK